jgi:hypothetical protein
MSNKWSPLSPFSVLEAIEYWLRKAKIERIDRYFRGQVTLTINTSFSFDMLEVVNLQCFSRTCH